MKPETHAETKADRAGEKTMKETSYLKAVTEALREEMLRDEKVFIAGEDVGECGGPFAATRNLFREFGPKRVRDTPISESAIIGLAIGAAATGMRPVVEIMFSDFIATCWDQVVNQAAKMRFMFGGSLTLPLVIRTQMGAGQNAGPQHSQSIEAWAMHVPGLKVVMPSTAYDAKGLLKAAIRDDNPVLFIENRICYKLRQSIPEEDYVLPLGVADVKREGRDVTVVAVSNLVHKALAAAALLAGEGIEAEVVDPRSILPLDIETIKKSVRKTSRLVIVHEDVRFAGMGAEIAAAVSEEVFDYLDAPIKRVAAPFMPVPFSKPLEEFYLPNEGKIVKAVHEVLQ